MEIRNMRKKSNKGSIDKQRVTKENDELRQQLAQLREILECNKRALRVSVDGASLQQQRLLTALYDQNQTLRSQLSKQQIQSQSSISHALIHHQIVKASEEQQKTVINELNGKLVDLRRQLRDREGKMLDLQKTHPVIDSQNALQVKLVEVTNTNSISTRFGEDMQILKEQLAVRDKAVVHEIETKNEIFRLNAILHKQIEELKTASLNRPPISISSDDQAIRPEQNSPEFNTSEFQNDKSCRSSDAFDSLLYIDQNLPAPIVQEPLKKPGCVPKLQMGKAKQIQEIIVKSMFDEEKPKGTVSMKEVSMIKEQLVALRKHLNCQRLRNVQLSRKADDLTKVNVELQERNLELQRSKGFGILVVDGQLQQELVEQYQNHGPQDLSMSYRLDLSSQIERMITTPKTPGPFTRKERSISEKL